MKNLRVLIVGGGIGGFSAAIALAKDGHQVTLLEAASEFAEVCMQLVKAASSRPNSIRRWEREYEYLQILCAS